MSEEEFACHRDVVDPPDVFSSTVAPASAPPTQDASRSGVPVGAPGGAPPTQDASRSGVPVGVPGVPAAAQDDDESSSEEPWQKLRRQGSQQKPCNRTPTPQAQFVSAVAALARASAALALQPISSSAPPTKKCTTKNDEEVSSGVPGKNTADDDNAEEEKEGEVAVAAVAPGRAPRKPRATRGSQGTFGGRRPPKDPAKLKVFLAKKEVHQKHKEEARVARTAGKGPLKEPSAAQAAYWEHMRTHMLGENSPDNFRQAAKAWCEAKAPTKQKPTDTPKKNTAPESQPRHAGEVGGTIGGGTGGGAVFWCPGVMSSLVQGGCHHTKHLAWYGLCSGVRSVCERTAFRIRRQCSGVQGSCAFDHTALSVQQKTTLCTSARRWGWHIGHNFD